MIPYRYISIEGNIGAGKTSLATMLSRDLNARLVLEEFADNPFLPKFYENPERYAFPLELSFLSERFSQLTREVVAGDLFAPQVVSDYFIAKCQIFARNNLQPDEYHLFLKMYEVISSSCPKPDLLVYLYRDVADLKANIRERGREYEKNISDEYLENIQHQYMEFIRQHSDMRVLKIQMTGVDFVKRWSDYERIKQIISCEYPVGIQVIETL